MVVIHPSMLKRTLYFSNPYHLSGKLDQLIITNKDSGEVKQTPVEDLGFVVLDHPQITITQNVMQLLAANNTAVIFCDKKHHPNSMLFHLDTHQVQNERFRAQVGISEPLKKQLWQQTIKAKIRNQAAVLQLIKENEKPLLLHSKKVRSGDPDNFEARAARYYWKYLFSPRFKRERFGLPPNPSLNYGYTIVRAAVARSLVGSGLLPTLGIHHRNKYNAFCLADDIMEPYRPFVDYLVWNQKKKDTQYHDLNNGRKAEFLELLSSDVLIGKKKRPLMIALSETSASLSQCFEGKAKRIKYPTFANA